MKRLLFLLLCTPFSLSAAPILGEKAEISIITCSPGDELYSVFGHSAVRVFEPGKIDLVYNYGTFEFTDDFYLQFAQGKLNYRLSRSDFASFNYEYIMTGRGVQEQVLDLDSLQAQQLFDYMETNYLPENRYYLYDFFYDNCATRIRDVLVDVLHSDLQFNSNFASDSATFRNMIDMYLVGMPWGDFGIDLALGAPCDYKLQPQQNMFLPDFVFSELALATLNGRLLVRETRVILEPEFILSKAPYDLPVILAAIFAGLMMLYLLRAVIVKKRIVALERGFLIVFGLLGVAVFLLWFATDHVTTRLNYNLAWAFPLHLIAAFFSERSRGFFHQYFRFFAVFYLLFLITAWAWPQEFHAAAYLLTVGLMAICVRIGFFPSGKRA